MSWRLKDGSMDVILHNVKTAVFTSVQEDMYLRDVGTGVKLKILLKCNEKKLWLNYKGYTVWKPTSWSKESFTASSTPFSSWHWWLTSGVLICTAIRILRKLGSAWTVCSSIKEKFFHCLDDSWKQSFYECCSGNMWVIYLFKIVSDLRSVMFDALRQVGTSELECVKSSGWIGSTRDIEINRDSSLISYCLYLTIEICGIHEECSI
jgi:hypothetical protein